MNDNRLVEFGVLVRKDAKAVVLREIQDYLKNHELTSLVSEIKTIKDEKGGEKIVVPIPFSYTTGLGIDIRRIACDLMVKQKNSQNMVGANMEATS